MNLYFYASLLVALNMPLIYRYMMRWLLFSVLFFVAVVDTSCIGNWWEDRVLPYFVFLHCQVISWWFQCIYYWFVFDTLWIAVVVFNKLYVMFVDERMRQIFPVFFAYLWNLEFEENMWRNSFINSFVLFYLMTLCIVYFAPNINNFF